MSSDDDEKKNRISGPILVKPPTKKPSSKDLKGMKPVHVDLPQLPFYAGVIGPRHRGKTVLLFTLLEDIPGMYGSAFKRNNIYVYSPTAGLDETLIETKLPASAFKNSETTDLTTFVNIIKSEQKRYQRQNNRTGVLLVLDDITNVHGAWSPLIDLAFYGRHNHIHVLYVAHKMSSIPRGVRTQTQQWIIYEPHEQSEHQWILEMFSRTDTMDIWRKKLLDAWSEPYQFVYIDFECKENERVYRKGFKEPLFSPEEIEYMKSGSSFKYMNKNMLEFDTLLTSTINEENKEPKKVKYGKKTRVNQRK